LRSNDSIICVMKDEFRHWERLRDAVRDTIFDPQFELTERIHGAIEHIERSAWLIENMLIMPKHEAWFKRQVWVRRAAATTQIEGASLNEAQVQELSRKGAPGRATEDEQANINALSAYQFIDYLSDEKDIPLDETVIRQLNREFLRGMDDERLTPGRYRNGQNTVGRFTPPDNHVVADLMRGFVGWLQSNEELHPVLAAGVAHIHLVAVHPFWDGNGRVARGLATLLLQRSERFHFKRLLSIESFMYATRDDYFSAIERTLGTSFTPGYDATPWLEFFTETLVQHAWQLQRELTDWHRETELVIKALQKADITHRQADAMIFALKMGRITRADYAEIAAVADVTASRDLAGLLAEGWLIPHGNGRGRYYEPVVPKPEP